MPTEFPGTSTCEPVSKLRHFHSLSWLFFFPPTVWALFFFFFWNMMIPQGPQSLEFPGAGAACAGHVYSLLTENSPGACTCPCLSAHELSPGHAMYRAQLSWARRGAHGKCSAGRAIVRLFCVLKRQVKQTRADIHTRSRLCFTSPSGSSPVCQTCAGIRFNSEKRALLFPLHR